MSIWVCRVWSLHHWPYTLLRGFSSWLVKIEPFSQIILSLSISHSWFKSFQRYIWYTCGNRFDVCTYKYFWIEQKKQHETNKIDWDVIKFEGKNCIWLPKIASNIIFITFRVLLIGLKRQTIRNKLNLSKSSLVTFICYHIIFLFQRWKNGKRHFHRKKYKKTPKSILGIDYNEACVYL